MSESSTTVTISDRAVGIATLHKELNEIESEQLKLAAQLSAIAHRQLVLARKAGALNDSIEKLMRG